jgi:DNA helicase-2/ATP-dependent DNA helicase PcrA
MNKLDLSGMNPPQLQAVTSTQGPLLVLAGAGSGKTRVLTSRIAFIIAQGLARPEEILAVTFTNKAAGEMKERIMKLLTESGAASGYVSWMGTFHSICVKILRRDGYRLGLSANFSIYDSNDQIDAVKTAMESLNMSTKDVNPRAIHSHISMAKNELIGPDDYRQYANNYFAQQVARVYPIYQKILKESQATDFDDLLMLTVQLFEQYPEVLADYQQRFKYILVDEYQDTNHAQYRLVTLLAAAHRNLCVVGDDDQSIYAFRGATVRNILNFERDYPEALVIKLEQNYRSTKVILAAAHEVVSKNAQRSSKKLWTDNAEGELIEIYTAYDEKDEARWSVNRIRELLDSGVEATEIAVLYRTNAQSRSLEEEFLRQAVRYKIVGGFRFYDRQEIKDTLSYLQILYNPSNEAALKRIINVPKRGVGAKTQQDLLLEAAAKNLPAVTYLTQNVEHITHKGVKEFAILLRRLQVASESKTVAELIDYILQQSGYIKMLADGTTENESRLENLKELLSVASKYQQMEPQAGLRAFLEEVALLEGGPKEEVDNAVTLMTVHAAKGLEFKHVFLVGMEEGLFPHSRVFTDPKELEEERRLAYVAITRAKHNLYIVHADARLYFGSRQQNMRSRFVEDIPAKLRNHSGKSAKAQDTGWEIDFGDEWEQDVERLDVESGMKVRHEYFGVGTVLGADESTVKINFGGVYGVKELARDLAKLEIV